MNEPQPVEEFEQESELRPEFRYKFVLLDDITGVQLPVATDNLDKFTKTDMMKVVKAFREGVEREEKILEDRQKQAEKELNDDTHLSGNSTVAKRLRRSSKVRGQKSRPKHKS